MNEEQPMNEQESLRLITDMIAKAKASHFHENGTSAILWGSVVGFCGLMSFTERYFKFYIGFDVWILTLIAIIPQVIISIKEKRNRVIKTDMQVALDAVWTVYGISVFAVIAYINIIPFSSAHLFAINGTTFFQKDAKGLVESFRPFALSANSILMIIYAFPTLVTGLARRFKPMLYGAIACYIFFFISLYTSTMYDNLWAGLAGIGNWFIPGLILRNRYIKGKSC
jgi:uncharacterized protein with PQ loop repeat